MREGDWTRSNDRVVERDGIVRCDAFGCEETHPLDHESLGEECFGTGRWLGWVYLDLNRPDLFERVFRFCCVRHALYWMERECVSMRSIVQDPTPLDRALRSPTDEMARRSAGLGGKNP